MIISAIILAAVLTASSQNNQNDAHNDLLNTPCIECHRHLPFKGKPDLRSEVNNSCVACHQGSHGTAKVFSHPVNVAPSMIIPSDMPLDDQGRIVCITCHAFHGEYRAENGEKLYYLRRSNGKTFCYSCHKTLPGISIIR